MILRQMTAWVRKNCKFAQMDLTQAPRNWQDRDDAMRSALEFQKKKTYPNSAQFQRDEDLFNQTFEKMNVDKSDINAGDWKQDYGGAYRLFTGTIIASGKIFFPVRMENFWGKEMIMAHFKEIMPESVRLALEEIDSDPDNEDKTTWEIMFFDRQDDYVNIAIRGNINVKAWNRG